MRITDPFQLKNYLKARGLAPKDYLGQNFLIDETALAAIVAAADLKPTDTVLEVGPGLGVLTGELVAEAGRVWAVEKDSKLVELLKIEFAGQPNLKIINQDILRFHVGREIPGAYKVVANIPYYLTSKLMQFFLEMESPPERLVLMVQKEVGERVTAGAGELSILGISVQIYADVRIVASVSKNSFWPVPEVDSVVLKITPQNKYPEITDKKLFFRIVKMAFSGKRKMIQNTLAHGLKVEKSQIISLLQTVGIDPNTRPQDLEIKQWIGLYQELAGQESKSVL